MKNYLLTLALFAFGGAAHATSYYVSDCGSGASTQCVAGSDANAGTSPSAPWKSCDQVTTRFSGLAAGDQVLFARGSAQTACKISYVSNLNSRAANPIVLGAYTPSWASSGAPDPILRGTASTYGLSLYNSGNSTHDEGYVIQDIHFIGAGVSASMAGIILGNDVKYVTLQRIEVEQFTLGIQCAGGTNSSLAAGSDGWTAHIIIRNANIHNNRGIGLLTGCSDMLVENSTFDSNGIGMLDHHIYLTDASIPGTPARPVSQVVIRNNVLTNNSPYASTSAAAPTAGGCGAVAIVVHGQQTGVVIEGNTIAEPTIPNNGSCWGISADSGAYGKVEGFSNVVVRGNTVINYSVGIGLDMCDTCTVENNYIYSEFSAASGIAAPSKIWDAHIAGNTLNNNLTVRNNTVYLKNPSAGSAAIRVSREGNTNKVTSNLIYFGTSASSSTQCFNTTGLSPSAFAAFDYNLCFFSGSTGTWDSVRTTLSTQRAAGFDGHSLTVNPNVTPSVSFPYGLVVPSASPTIKAGHPTLSSAFAIGGLRRNTTSDIGANQLGATVVVPNAPTSVGIQ